jgi:hypothetical protein
MLAGSGLVVVILGGVKRNAVLCRSHLASNEMVSGGVSSRHSSKGQGTPQISSVAS